jgi:capping protein beta
MEDSIQPPEELRKLEVIANDAFDSYRELYYEGGTSSCWFWVTPDNGWACCVAIKKDSDKPDCRGTWSSVHVVDISMGVDADGNTAATYVLTATVMLSFAASNASSSNLAGKLTQRAKNTCAFESNLSHVQNIGSLIEAVEKRLLVQMEEVCFGKINEIPGKVRRKTSRNSTQSSFFETMLKMRSVSTQ